VTELTYLKQTEKEDTVRKLASMAQAVKANEK